MKRTIITVAAGIAATLFTAGAAVPTAGAQGLVNERLSLLPAQVSTGSGTVRLDGMGGFEAAVADENYEINLLDFGANPAGFGDDRDSWTVEFRYGHGEYAERDDRLRGNDVFLNEGAFRGGFYVPGDLGVGLQVDYAEVEARDFSSTRNNFTVVGFQGVVNKYVTPTLSIGASINYATEDEEVFSRSIYNIDHENATVRGGLGAGWHPVPGVALGARGELIGTQVDGESRGDFHTDTFDWSRPGGLVAVHGTVDRGRLRGGVDFATQEINGEEQVRVSWSERFVFNPTDDNVSMILDTFAEDRKTSLLRTRWQLEVNPEVTVGLTTVNGTEEFTIVTNRNILGSRTDAEVETRSSALIGGASWKLFEQRLLLAGELKIASTEVEDRSGVSTLTNTLDETVIRVGGEYFLGEFFVGRGGLVFLNQDYALDTNPDLDGGFATTRVAAGFGFTPSGGIWQFDAALDVDLDSELDSKQINASAYIRYLF